MLSITLVASQLISGIVLRCTWDVRRVENGARALVKFFTKWINVCILLALTSLISTWRSDEVQLSFCGPPQGLKRSRKCQLSWMAHFFPTVHKGVRQVTSETLLQHDYLHLPLWVMQKVHHTKGTRLKSWDLNSFQGRN